MINTTQLIRSVEEFTDITKYVYVGMPYGGLVHGKTDFHNTFFTPRTDVGPTTRSMSAFFEHGKFAPIGFHEIGTARMLPDENPDGRLFEIIVSRANKYHELVSRLYREGILYGSAQAYATGYVADEDTGELLRFIPAEWSFSVTPSNLLAKPVPEQTIRSIFNDFNEQEVRYFIMGDVKKDNAAEAVAENATTAATVEAQPQPVETARTTFTEQVQAILKEGENGISVARSEPLTVIAEALKTVLDKLDAIGAKQAALETQQTALGAAVESNKTTTDRSLTDIQSAMLSLAESVTKSVAAEVSRSTLQGILGASEDEKDILRRRAAQEEGNTSPARNAQLNVATVGFTPPPGVK